MSMKQFIEIAGGRIEPNFDKYPQDRNNENKLTFTDYSDEQSMNCPIWRTHTLQLLKYSQEAKMQKTTCIQQLI